LFATCTKDQDEKQSLKIISTYNIAIPECSGLGEYKENQFVTVSDRLEKVYIISKTGQVLDSLNFDGQNPEGVYWEKASGHVFVVEEKTNTNYTLINHPQKYCRINNQKNVSRTVFITQNFLLLYTNCKIMSSWRLTIGELRF
jgi:hypothetical protein